VGVLVLLLGSAMKPHSGLAAVVPPDGLNQTQGLRSAGPCTLGWRKESEEDVSQFQLPKVLERAKKKRYAYVMMAYDERGATPQYLWRALALCRALHRLSDYPTLLMTNTTQLPDGTDAAESFRRLNVKIKPVQVVPFPKGLEETMMQAWRVAYWKLQIWRLTGYDKLIWLDTDAIITRSLDYIFDLEPNWGQKDAWVCSNAKDVQDWLCSGIMLIRPDEKTYKGLLKYAEKKDVKWWENGDQRLIDHYFREVKGTPMKLFNLRDAAFGKCLGMIPNLFNETPGEIWNLPAFVHKSSVHDECFQFLIAKQLREIDGKLVNICHYHPLGQYWRNMFCEGMNILKTKTPITDAFCDDFLWYRHR